MDQYKEYDFIAENIFYPIYEDIAAAILKRTGITKGEMLDIGCGGGHMGFAVMKLAPAFNGTFIDIRPDAIDLTLNRAVSLGFENRCSAFLGNVDHLNFKDNSFDLVISRGSMPFWENQLTSFKEIYRILSPGGKAYIGGGLGNTKLQASIKEQMESMGKNTFKKSRKDSKALPTQDYIDLFSSLGCTYEVFENNGEGRWFMFVKGEKQD